jgi:F-type H+-transporting ATPase subunit alpha
MEKELAMVFQQMREEAEKSRFSIGVTEEGKVLSVGDGIVQVAGLRDAKL